MKTLYVTLLFLLFISNGKAQPWKNLVPNYSFEKVKSGFPYGGPSSGNYYCGNYKLSGESKYNATEHYWAEVYDWTHPLKAHWWCTGNPSVGTANVLPNHQRSGTYGGNGTEGEFLVTQLKYDKLEAGKTYYMELFHNNESSSSVWFSNGRPRQCNGKKIKSPSHGILENKFDTKLGNHDWVRTRKYFKIINNYNYMTLGSGGKSGDGKDGGDWDDIRIYEVQPNKCRTNWYFDNTVFNYPMEVFQASNNIYIGNGVDPEDGTNHIAGDVIQYASSSVVLRAGNQIIIDHGTFIEGDETKVFEISPEPLVKIICVQMN